MNTITASGVSVVIPVFNEQENVLPLIEEVESALSSVTPFEVIIVDDASTDHTVQILLSAKPDHPNLRVVQHKKNAGQSAAVVSGVKAARYDWIATLDGDGQNDPADIPALMQAADTVLRENNTSVLCMGHRNQRNDNFVRKASSKIANGVRGSFLKDECPDTGCGIKLFSRDVFLRLPHFRNCHRFLPALFKRAGAVVINVPVNHRERLRGQSKYGVMNRLWVGIVDLIGVAWLIRRPIDVEAEHD